MALNENITDENRLEELGGSDYEIVDGEPNIKGWEVKNALGEKIGEVDELLFNPKSRSVRYLVLDLDGNELKLEHDDRKVLIPIGLAELHSEDMDEDERDEVEETGETHANGVYESGLNEDHDLVRTEANRDEIAGERYAAEDDDREDDDDTVYDPYDDGDVVILPNVTAEQLNALPTYEKDKVSPAMESTIREVFEGAGVAGAGYVAEDFYNHDHFNEDRFYNGGNAEDKVAVIKEELNIGKKEVETGGARITSRLVERPVQENISLREEHLSVERTPVNRPVTDADQAFKESEIELTEYAEVPVVSKEARVVEEVSLNKTVEEKEETIHDTVRSTEVETERLPGETGHDYNDSK